MVRLTNTGLARALHDRLYERLVGFSQQYTPEGMAHVVVSLWLSRMYLNDERLHVLVNLDDHMTIVEHAVIEVNEEAGRFVIMVHQAQRDKPNKHTLDEGMDYIHGLQQALQATVVFFTQSNPKAYERLYGYKIMRYMLVRQYKADEDSEGAEEALDHTHTNGVAEMAS